MMKRLACSTFGRIGLLSLISLCWPDDFQSAAAADSDKSRPNVVLIAVDDLRAELGCYGHSEIHSPNIDSLAESGRRFERAYCQQAVCNPSRTSLMTGLRPDEIGVTGNHVHFRSKHPNVVTLSQHFMQHGYHAQSIGKIYHGVFPEGASKTQWDTMGDPQSWSTPTTRFGPRYYYTESGIAQAQQAFLAMYRPKDPQPDDWTRKLVFGPMTEAPDVDDETLYDGKVAAAAVNVLHDLKKSGEPFFLAVGFIKPHTPFVAPKKYWDLYDAADIELSHQPFLPKGAPTFAGHGSGEIRRYTDQPNRGKIPAANQRRMKHGYYACISYIDAQIGKVLTALEAQGLADNTIVALFSDHGYHLGEHGLWGKTTNFELDTRVPLIIRVPGMNGAGESTRALAELIDLYPTLVDLADLPTPKHLQGTSLKPVIRSPGESPDDIALSQFPRGGNADTGGNTMGYSLRTDRWRYTEWIDRASGAAVARELYDHSTGDQFETANLANDSIHAGMVSQLSTRLRTEIGSYVARNEFTAVQKPAAGDAKTVTVFERDSTHGYRIPALTTTSDGTLLAFAERRVGLHDHAQNDIVLRRSQDEGKTWGPLQVVADEGGDSLNDPCVVVLESGRVLLRYTRFPQGVHARDSDHTVIAEPGYGGPKNVRIYLTHSDDDGRTWSDPQEVTKAFRRESAVSIGSPGRAIQLTQGEYSGRILFPVYEIDNLGDGDRASANSVVFSDDDGQTWTLSARIDEGGTTGGGNEAQLIEIDDGDVLITSRNQWGDANVRKIATSSDGGTTWSSHRLAGDLVTPTCMSSVERVYPSGSKPQGWLVHSLPNTTNRRSNGTLFISKDEGQTWKKSQTIEPDGFAYSCLSRLPNGDLGCLYEAGRYASIEFVRVPLQSLVLATANRAKTTSDSTSFEDLPPGDIRRIETEIGEWRAAAGHAEIDNGHHRTGNQCLHLLGGENRAVELSLNGEFLNREHPPSVLTFHAERWTKRSPFAFRVSQFSKSEGWKEIYNGDEMIRIGGFLTKVSIPLERRPTRLRFTCTSPVRSGILIDDMALTAPTPQRISDVVVDSVKVPVLVGLPTNPLLRMRVDVEGALNPISLLSVKVDLAGTIANRDIASVQMLATGDAPVLDETALFSSQPPVGQTGEHQFDIHQELQAGSNYFWLSCTLNDDADIDQTIEASCRSLVFSDGTKARPAAESVLHRLGVAVRRAGQDAVHTSRIPGLATTNEGTLIGVFDLRRRSGGDLPGDIDVGMSRSTDGGRTWEPTRVIMDMGDDPQWNHDGIGDPAILVDRNTGTIWVAATWSHGNRSWRGSGPGMRPDETGQLMLVRSDDDGMTWSQPINITEQVKRPEWCFVLQGPGKGITMRDGTLVFAAQYQDPPQQKRLPHSTIIYSRNHGETWQVGTGVFDDTTESQVIEIEPGVLMLNCRYNREPTRVVATTADMGQTWQIHPTSRRALIEPGACMASLINLDQEIGRDVGGWLLFSNPDSQQGRHHITIKASDDGGMTWPKQHRLLLDEGNGRGYSCLSMVDEKTIGILYEGSRAHMTFQRIPLNDLVGNHQASRAHVEHSNADSTQSALQLPRVFGDHMVLQAGMEMPVWGTAKPLSQIEVRLDDESKFTTADQSGQWEVRFSPREATTIPTVLSITSDKQRLTFRNILIGEVWVCAGQSNMEWPLSRSANGHNELTKANRPQIRLLHLLANARGSSGRYKSEHLSRLTPSQYFEGQWEIASPESARDFSAVAWHFGRYLQDTLKTPVGLICAAVGGTPAEAWIPRDALLADPQLKMLVAGNWLDNKLLGEFCRTRGLQNLLQAIQDGEAIPGDALGPNHSFKPGYMWEAGIEPLIPYAIRGAIWYQGESNAENSWRIAQHNRLFPLMIDEWRASWNQGPFPFLYAQLPALNRPNWPSFRDQQRRMLSQLENVGMAVTIDTGHPTNVHPTSKQPVGERLAKWALGTTYNVNTESAYSGPLYRTVEEAGASIVVHFDHSGSGLETTGGGPPLHFEVAGSNGIFYPASATIVGQSAVSVSSLRVAHPKHVRYAWMPYPTPPVNLVNSAGLPASPFSTADPQTEQQTVRASQHRPNILLIVGEDHGCELSCYGDPVIQTPHIDRLASQGILFESGYVTQSVCSPSRSTIFTGLYPHQNGQLGLATHQYGWFEKWPTTYSLLKDAGYRTGLIGKTHIIPLEAVEPFVDFRFQKSSNFSKSKVADYATEAGKFFRASDEPFFITVNYPDAHWPLQGQVDGLPAKQVNPNMVRVMPYVGDENDRLRKIAQNYYDCMLRLDACVGQLLEQLEESGKSENTLVVFIGDHGAQMARGKVTVYEGGMRVPFIARWPGIIAPQQRSQALVSTIDLLPTFMDAAGTATPEGLPGRSLRPVFDGYVDAEFREYLACERNCDAAQHTFPQRTIRDARYKLIYSPVRDREDPAARYYRVHGATHWSGCLTDEELAHASARTKAGYARWLNPPELQLYDLRNDPHEWNNLADDVKHNEAKQRLWKALRNWQVDTRDPLVDPAKLRQLLNENDAVFKAKLRSPKDGWQYLDYLHPDKVETSPAPQP